MTLSKKDARMMSEIIREVLSNPDVMESIIKGTGQKPPYWDMLPERTGLTAIVIAQMLKAMGGDTAAFSALSKYGFGEKIQIDTSDFYNAKSIDIHVVDTPKFLEDEIESIENANDPNNILEGEVENDEETESRTDTD